jgi:signal transduction histidine kinase
VRIDVGIRGRLLALTMGVAVPFMVTGFVGLYLVWTASRDKLDSSVREQAELVAVAFDHWIEAEQQPLVALAASEAGRPASQPLTEQELRSVILAHPNWLALEARDAADRVVISHPPEPTPLLPVLADSLHDQLASGDSSAAQFDWMLGGDRPVLVMAAVRKNGGAISALVDATSATEAMRGVDLPSGSVIVLFDRARRVVLRMPHGEASVGVDRSDSPMFKEVAEAKSAVVEMTSQTDGVQRVSGIARVGSTGFVVGVGVPSAVLYEPARVQFTSYLLFSLVALTSAVVASLLIARRIAVPVEYLRGAAQHLAAGDLTARAPDLGPGEMGELSRVFNHMAEALQQREATRAEVDRLKSEFVSSVSHELRTPLTTVKTLTQVLQRGGETAEERRRYLEAIASECDRQIDFVLDLLDLSRIEAGAFTIAPECVDAVEVVAGCVATERFAAEAAGHELVADVPSELPYVRAERRALRRVLRCLVENAITYTPHGGRITVSGREADGAVVLAVTDTGRGIAAGDLDRLFERYYRASESAGAEPSGVGLGLYLARTTVEHLGGTISVESEVGRGSTFSVWLPRWAPDGAFADGERE